MWRSTLRLVAINTLVFALLAEAVGLFAYYADTGRLFYTAERQYPRAGPDAGGTLIADGLHPYFGPIHRPGARAASNNFGFSSPRAYPFARTDPRQFIVGIFGGSVAEQFCEQGAPAMAAALSRQAWLAGRAPVTLCFGHEGYKQPQQTLVLAYFLSIGQEFDLVVNIDGFNEVALGTMNRDRGRDISMPSPLHLDPIVNVVDRSTMTPDMLASLAAIVRDRTRLDDLAGRRERSRSAAVHFLLDRYAARVSGRLAAERGRLALLPAIDPASSPVLVTPALRPRPGAAIYDDIAAEWRRGSVLMNEMIVARGGRYVHVIQPNQYFTRRRFSREEAAVAINPASPFRAAVELGYPVLMRASGELAAGVRFVDATGAFDREVAPMYADDCCHYTAAGYHQLGEFIAARTGDR